jgi:hypothetical protein
VGDVDAMNLLLHGTSKVEARAAEVVGGDVLKDAGLLLPIMKLGD